MHSLLVEFFKLYSAKTSSSQVPAPKTGGQDYLAIRVEYDIKAPDVQIVDNDDRRRHASARLFWCFVLISTWQDLL